MKPRIPRQIHQIWFQGTDELSAEQRARMSKWVSMNPGYYYKCWNGTEMEKYIRVKLGKVGHKTYSSFVHMHQKIDFFKYVLLLKSGGCYIDMDVEPLKPIDTILTKLPDAEVIVSTVDVNEFEKWLLIGQSDFINNGVIFAAPNSDVMQHIVTTLVGMSYRKISCKDNVTKIKCIQDTTGPAMFTRLCLKFKGTKHLTILDSKYLEPCYGLDKFCQPTKDAVTDHRHEQTWIPWLFRPLITIYFFIKYTLARFSHVFSN
jgi:mannosyltransferase OCH1-like enzyme